MTSYAGCVNYCVIDSPRIEPIARKMAMEDPFFIVKEEIQQSLKSAKSVHAQWAKLLESGADPGRVENAQTELNKALKSIEWDLQDLDQTISIAQRNPSRFHLEAHELDNRKRFVADMWAAVNKMKSDMNSSSSRSQTFLSQRGALLGPSYEGPKRAVGRYAKMEQEMQRSNQDFINRELQEQQQVMQEQDRDLQKVHHSLHTLGQMGEEIGNELDDQNRMLDDMSHEAESTDSRLKALTARVDKVSKKLGDKCQIVTIIVLVVILVVIVILFIIPF